MEQSLGGGGGGGHDEMASLQNQPMSFRNRGPFNILLKLAMTCRAEMIDV